MNFIGEAGQAAGMVQDVSKFLPNGGVVRRRGIEYNNNNVDFADIPEEVVADVSDLAFTNNKVLVEVGDVAGDATQTLKSGLIKSDAPATITRNGDIYDLVPETPADLVDFEVIVKYRNSTNPIETISNVKPKKYKKRQPDPQPEPQPIPNPPLVVVLVDEDLDEGCQVCEDESPAVQIEFGLVCEKAGNTLLSRTALNEICEKLNGNTAEKQLKLLAIATEMLEPEFDLFKLNLFFSDITIPSIEPYHIYFHVAELDQFNLDAWLDMSNSGPVGDPTGHQIRYNFLFIDKYSTKDEEEKADLKTYMDNQKAPEGFKGRIDYDITRQGITVDYDLYGFPIFTAEQFFPGGEYVYYSYSLTGGSSDMYAANSWATGKPGFVATGTTCTINGVPHTWHHHQDGRSLFPVPSYLHNVGEGGFNHSGGKAVIAIDMQEFFPGPDY